MKQYLTFVNSKAGPLIGNPKLHKSCAPFSTIVSGINTQTEKLAEVAEYKRQEYVLGSLRYIRDTTDLINTYTLNEMNLYLRVPSFFVLMFVNYIHPSQKWKVAACREHS